MVKKPKSFLNALDALASIPDYERLIAQVSPALEYVRQHEDMLRQLTSNSVIDAIRQQEETIRHLTSNPIVDAFRQQEELTLHMLENPLVDARRGQETILKQFAETQTALNSLKLHGSLFDEARRIAAQSSEWQDMASRAVTEFRDFIPESSFAEANRVAEAFRLSAADLRAFESTFVTTNWDATLTAAIQQVRQRAQDIASDRKQMSKMSSVHRKPAPWRPRLRPSAGRDERLHEVRLVVATRRAR